MSYDWTYKQTEIKRLQLYKSSNHFYKTGFSPILQVCPSVVSSVLFSTLTTLFWSIVSPETGLFPSTGELNPSSGTPSGGLIPTP